MAGVTRPNNSDIPGYPQFPPGMTPGQYGVPPANNTRPRLTPTGDTGYETFTPGNAITGTSPTASTFTPQSPEAAAAALGQQRYVDSQNRDNRDFSEGQRRYQDATTTEQARYNDAQRIGAEQRARGNAAASSAQAAIQGLLGGAGGTSSGSSMINYGGSGTVSGPGGLPNLMAFPGGGGGGVGLPQTAQLQVPDMSAAEQAVFDRAKDQQGQITRSAMSGLQSSLAGRGLLGGGYEAKGARDVVQQGAGALGNLTREQAIQHLGDAQKMAEAGYTGAITQRGQDITAQTGAQQRALDAWKSQNEQAIERYKAGVEGTIAQQNAANAQKSLALQAATALGRLY